METLGSDLRDNSIESATMYSLQILMSSCASAILDLLSTTVSGTSSNTRRMRSTASWNLPFVVN